jgi:hypothetical protein
MLTTRFHGRRAVSLLAILSSAVSCGASLKKEANAVSNSQSGPTRSADQITWQVADAFRLITSPGSTAEQIVRYKYYLDKGHEAAPTPIPLPTWWRQGGADPDYDAGYELSPKALPIRVTAPARFQGTCQWVVDGTPQTPAKPCADSEIVVCTVANGCDVSVEIVGATGTSASKAHIRPRNIILATLGDSYASGEGVPDARSYGVKHGITLHDARWMDTRCHRSLFSGHAISGLLYTLVNPHVAVTYVSYACSGALLTSGLLEGYEGQDPKDPKHLLPPQLDKLRDILNRQAGGQADFLTLSFGGNDIGFGTIVTDGLLKSDERFTRIVPILVRQGLDKLKGAAETAGAKEKTAPLARHVAVVEYPNPTVVMGLPGSYRTRLISTDLVNECADGFANTVNFAPLLIARALHLFDRNFDSQKINTIEVEVSQKLRDFGQMFADQMGATLIHNPATGIFSDHGFCAPSITSEESPDRWINTLGDSFKTQGTFLIFGAMHPNIYGQSVFARELVRWIAENECDEHNSASSRSDDEALWRSICDEKTWHSDSLLFQKTDFLPQKL